jgi:hypothetical protein
MIAMRDSALLLIKAKKKKNQKSLGYPKGPRRVTRGNLGPACTPHTMQNLVFASWALARLGAYPVGRPGQLIPNFVCDSVMA